MRKMNRILKVKSILFPSLGLICILFSDRVTLLLPYLLGSAMVLVGTLMVVSYFKEKKFFEKQADELAYSIMMFIMGDCIPTERLQFVGGIRNYLGNYRYKKGI